MPIMPPGTLINLPAVEAAIRKVAEETAVMEAHETETERTIAVTAKAAETGGKRQVAVAALAVLLVAVEEAVQKMLLGTETGRKTETETGTGTGRGIGTEVIRNGPAAT